MVVAKDDACALRQKIKDCLKFMDMTHAEAADIISGEDELYICNAESFKKDLQRCKNIERLDAYLAILRKSEKFKKVDKVRDGASVLTEQEREEIRAFARMIKQKSH